MQNLIEVQSDFKTVGARHSCKPKSRETKLTAGPCELLLCDHLHVFSKKAMMRGMQNER